jgi:hypothetical protein
MDQGTVSRIEHQVRTLSDYELVAFAKCLKVTVGWLCGERSPLSDIKGTRATPAFLRH